MEKIIHYCWFGDKPLPKLAKKCLKSWKKYLPEFKIMKWSEDNVDLNECPFIRGAYDQKKWAFVADYVRTKALKEYGGIYFDTDMEVTKDISHLFNDETDTFLGIEDSGYVAVGVWYEKNKNALLPTRLLNTYRELKEFDIDAMVDLTIPKMLSEILNGYDLKYGRMEVQHLKNRITIYPRDYFYPYSYDWKDNAFSENTCMIHYYDASWIPFREKIDVLIVRKFGKNIGYKIINILRLVKRIIKKCLKIIFFPLVLLRRHKINTAHINKKYKKNIEKIKNNIEKVEGDYIVMYNPDWKGVTSSTKELFENLIPLSELYRKKDIKEIAQKIANSNIKQIIFSSFAIGWKDLIVFIKKYNPNIKIKTFWHGSHSQILETYGWERNKEIIQLHRENLIDTMGVCKKSLVGFYKSQNLNVKFLTNNVDVDKNLLESIIAEQKENNNTEKVKIGLYAAKCSDWRKNMYSQMAAVSLLENVVLDIVPLDNNARKFAKLLDIEITGESKSLSREDLLKRMSKNDINLYVTFSECAPMLPLESLELGVPCILGNNNHYFKESELEKLLVVNIEDDIEEIKQKIQIAISEKQKINKLYKDFKTKNLKQKEENINDFLRM